PEYAALVVESDFVIGNEVVPFATDAGVVVAIHPQLDRTSRLERKERCNAREKSRLALLAAERAAHAPAFDDDVVRRNAERMRDLMLDLARMLRRRAYVHRPVLFGH